MRKGEEQQLSLHFLREIFNKGKTAAVRPDAPMVRPDAPSVRPDAPPMKSFTFFNKGKTAAVRPDAPPMKSLYKLICSRSLAVRPDAPTVRPDAPQMGQSFKG